MLALYTASFIAIERLGLFSDSIPPYRGIVMIGMVMIAATASIALLVVYTAVNRNRMTRIHWLGLFSVVLMVAGIWTSRFADFEIDVVLTEGQVYETNGYRSVGLLHMGLFSSVPKFRIITEDVVLDGGEGGATNINRTRGRLQLHLPGGEPSRAIMLSQSMPQFHEGMVFKVKSFGHSLRYSMKQSKRVLDSNFISLRLFPSGSEDFFRLLSAHTFYVRYYPGHQEGGEERPLKVKIARNKEIIFNGYLALKEAVPYEDASISFEEMRNWVEVSISRRWGELMAWAGLTFSVIFAGLLIVRRSRPRVSL